jgi:hypothetical protein
MTASFRWMLTLTLLSLLGTGCAFSQNKPSSAQCGVPEFSDPADPHRGCAGLPSCKICRASDDGTQAEDDITVNSQ